MNKEELKQTKKMFDELDPRDKEWALKFLENKLLGRTKENSDILKALNEMQKEKSVSHEIYLAS